MAACGMPSSYSNIHACRVALIEVAMTSLLFATPFKRGVAISRRLDIYKKRQSTINLTVLASFPINSNTILQFKASIYTMMSPLLILAVVLLMIYSSHSQLSNPPPGEPFYIIHSTSGRAVHPDGGSATPGPNTKLVLFSCGFGEERIQFLFESSPIIDGYGYIKHVTSDNYIHPMGRSQHPGENTPLVLHPGKYGACLFGFNHVDGYLYNHDGKTWHPNGGSTCPGDSTELILHSNPHVGTMFHYQIAQFPLPLHSAG